MGKRIIPTTLEQHVRAAELLREMMILGWRLGKLFEGHLHAKDIDLVARLGYYSVNQFNPVRSRLDDIACRDGHDGPTIYYGDKWHREIERMKEGDSGK